MHGQHFANKGFNSGIHKGVINKGNDRHRVSQSKKEVSFPQGAIKRQRLKHMQQNNT